MSETTRTVRAHRVGLPGRLQSDQSLASRIGGGDPAACDEMFRRYHQQIYRFCAAMVGPEEAKDVLQNVMTKAITAMPDNEDFKMKPWLYRVARNECIDHLRQAGRTTPGFDPDSRTDETGRADPHRAAVDRERLRNLVDDLNELPEKQRSTLVMRELSGLGYPEIAAALGTSESGAKQIVYEARLSLEQAELGRQLDCAEVRESISSRDRRRLKGRKIRSHMRSCRACSNFERSISERQAGFQSLFPALPLGASIGVLDALREGGSTLAAGGSSGGAAAGGVLGGSVASGVIAKGTVALLVAGGIGVGTAEVVQHRNGSQQMATRSVDRGSGSVGQLVGPVESDAGAASAAAREAAKVAQRTTGPVAGEPEGNAADPALKEQARPAAERVTPGLGAGPGPASLPEAAAKGQSRADQASGTIPGQTGAAPPSRKPVSPPGQSGSPPASVGSSHGAGGTSQGKSAEAPAVGRPESPGKSGK